MGAESHPSRAVLGRRQLIGAVLALAAAGVAVSVGMLLEPPEAEPKVLEMGWRPVLSLAGGGTMQTESFQIDTGQWRIKWSAAAEANAGPEHEFRVGVHSAVSGRLMNVAVDHAGAGEGVAYVAEEPRPFFLSIESTGFNWTVQVEEGILGEREKNAP